IPNIVHEPVYVPTKSSTSLGGASGMSFWSAARERDHPPSKRRAMIPDVRNLERMSFLLGARIAIGPPNLFLSGFRINAASELPFGITAACAFTKFFVTRRLSDI